ncbi:MAG TPA: DEAD/DEAH box helicase [Gemmata sp.]|nr:DEAD/DEAH box helicase [Gemmata sp.]
MEQLLIPPKDGDDRINPDLEPDGVPSEQLIDATPLAMGVEFSPTQAEDLPDDQDDSDTEVDEIDEILGEDAENSSEAIIDPDHESAPPPEIDPAMTFADLKLNRAVIDALTQSKYTHPTPIQEAVIPPALHGKDVIGQAQTGTGKTAAFILPFLNRWRPHRLKGPIGLVMTPTRELALQVAKEAERLAPSKNFNIVPVYGGTGMVKQLKGLTKGCDLVVGTPGRMLDHLQRGSMSLDHVRYVVLDEADRMLDIGFRPDIERILKRCPLKRQTLLMSATVPDTIKRLVNRYMSDPIHLHMTPNTPTVDKIRQMYFTVDAEKKFELLKRVIAREQPRQCLIFIERKRWADNLYKQLKWVVPKSAVIHGDLPQSQRERIMAAFRTSDIKYLIATDVMSRGIDVDNISHVVNYDLPMDIENYVHRIGRTGRIGKDGIAISFVTPEQGEQLTQIEVMINRLIERDELPGVWYTPRKVTVVAPAPPPPPPVKRDEQGWGVEDDFGPIEKLGTGDTGTATTESEGTTVPSNPTTPAKKPVFGKTRRRYTDRL